MRQRVLTRAWDERPQQRKQLDVSMERGHDTRLATQPWLLIEALGKRQERDSSALGGWVVCVPAQVVRVVRVSRVVRVARVVRVVLVIALVQVQVQVHIHADVGIATTRAQPLVWTTTDSVWWWW